MASKKLPTFPKFTWDEYYWVTSAKLPAWKGFQRREKPRQAVADAGKSDGVIKIVFAPDDRDDEPLSKGENGLVRWVVDHQAAIHDAMLKALFEAYPAMREKLLDDGLGEEETAKVMPVLDSPTQLKGLVEVVTIHVHQIEQDGKPFFGVEMECTWEQEHGVGVLLHGAKPLEVGGADTAFYLWMAKKYLRNQS